MLVLLLRLRLSQLFSSGGSAQAFLFLMWKDLPTVSGGQEGQCGEFWVWFFPDFL